MRGQSPALLHSTGNTGPVSRLGSARLLLTVHDLIFLETRPLRSWRQRLGRLYRRLIVPAALRRASWIVVDAAATRAQLVEPHAPFPRGRLERAHPPAERCSPGEALSQPLRQFIESVGHHFLLF